MAKIVSYAICAGGGHYTVIFDDGTQLDGRTAEFAETKTAEPIDGLAFVELQKDALKTAVGEVASIDEVDQKFADVVAQDKDVPLPTKDSKVAEGVSEITP